MKSILIFIATVFFSLSLIAKNYYLANSGNDSNNGTSTSTPWQSINKLNTVTLVAGDSIFFKAGDTFRGQITINQSGTSKARIVISSYGTGNKPIISGAEMLTNWTSKSNYYVANTNFTISNFFVNQTEQTLARYPNNGQYLSYDSTASFYLKDESLKNISPTLINNSKICVHTTQWCWEKSDVSAFASNKITYSSQMVGKMEKNFGYFLYNNLNHLDTIGEWFYDLSTKQIAYMPAASKNPTNLTCEGSAYQYGILLGNNVSYISIKGISFVKQADAGIYIPNATNQYINVDACYFQHQYNHGVNSKGKYTDIKNSYFREIDGIALYTNGTAFRPTISYNTFRNIGQYRNGGIGQQINLSAISAFSDSSYVHHNNIDSAGYCGISVDGAYGLVERNIVSHAMLINNDGGSLKSYGSMSHHTIFRNNFVSYGNGSTEGTIKAYFVTPALYFDNFVNSNSFIDNTVYNRTAKGIFVNSGAINNTLSGNVIYGGNYGIDLNGSQMTTTAITGMVVKKNVLFMRDPNGYCLRQVDFSNTFNMGLLDSNYYFQPYNAEHLCLRYLGNEAKAYSLTAWQTTGNDAHSKGSFVTWTHPEDKSELFMNQTDNTVDISLGTIQYRDLDNKEVCGTLRLLPYTSKVLIKTSEACAVTANENDLISQEILIFPNPSSEKIKINFSTSLLGAKYRIFDANGREVYQNTAQTTEEWLDVERFPSGLYLILVSGKKHFTSKFVKQ